MGEKYVQTVAVRLTVNVQHVLPRRPILSEDPVVHVRGVVDLSPDPTEEELPVLFSSAVQLHADGTFNVLAFEPTNTVMHGGRDADHLLGIYEHAFRRALRRTKLRILGVRP